MSGVYETKNEEVGQWRRFRGTGKWVILPASDRQKEPATFLVREKKDLDAGSFCPFCADNLNKGLEREEKPEELKGATFKGEGAKVKWIGEEETYDLMFEIDTNEELEGKLSGGEVPTELRHNLEEKANIKVILPVRKEEDNKWKFIAEINGEKVMYIIKKEDNELKIYYFELFKKVIKKNWKTCVIKNINPVLDQMTGVATYEEEIDPPYAFAQGLGICDIIIESQVHSKPLGVLDKAVCENVITTYLGRFNYLQKEYPNNLKYISIFHNHRREAGASIPHSHSQMFATPFIPIHIKKRYHKQESILTNSPQKDQISALFAL